MSYDPNNSMAEFLAGNSNPGVEAPESQPQQAPETNEQKLGRVLNDNAQLRAEMDAMRLEMQAARAQAQPVQPQGTAQDPQTQWYQWMRNVQAEAQVPEQLWLESPNEAFLRSSAAMGRRLWENVKSEAEKHANKAAGDVATQIALTAQFEGRYPDLFASEVGHIMVTQAATELRARPEFQRKIGNLRTVPEALDDIAQLAYKKLGRVPGAEAAPSPTAPMRKGTFGEPGGSRPMGAPAKGGDSQKNELHSMVEYARGHMIPE